MTKGIAIDTPAGSIYSHIPGSLREELLEILLEAKGFRMERIVSKGHATAPGEWCDQETAEWVIVLKGMAALKFEGEEDKRVMGPGDYQFIPAHRKHRVEWTARNELTVWLAFHYNP
jgi:cupin 2 domain-containing protein